MGLPLHLWLCENVLAAGEQWGEVTEVDISRVNCSRLESERIRIKRDSGDAWFKPITVTWMRIMR